MSINPENLRKAADVFDQFTKLSQQMDGLGPLHPDHDPAFHVIINHSGEREPVIVLNADLKQVKNLIRQQLSELRTELISLGVDSWSIPSTH